MTEDKSRQRLGLEALNEDHSRHWEQLEYYAMYMDGNNGDLSKIR